MPEGIKESFMLKLVGKKIRYLMFTLLLHLLVCSYSRVTRLDLFRIVARPEYGYITQLLQRINMLVSLGYEQVKACEVVANTSRDKFLRDFLLRYAQSIKVGEDLSNFLKREYESYTVIYSSEYDRSMVRLRRLSEAYTAVLSSTVFISITFTIMGMIWGGEFFNYLWIVAFSIIVAYCALAVMFYQMSPYEKIISSTTVKDSVRVILIISRMSIVLVIMLLACYLALSLIGITPLDNTPIVALMLGLPSLLIGIIGMRVILKIKALDERFPAFISTLASSLASLEASFVNAVKEVMRIDFGPLNKLIRDMKVRLDVGVSDELCWKLFEREASSELITNHSKIFLDSFKAGAPSTLIGDFISKATLNILTLRRKREEVSVFLRSLLLPLHPVLSAILALTLVIVIEFTGFMTPLQQGSLSAQIVAAVPIAVVEAFFFVILFATSIFNAIVMYITEGGHSINLLYYLGLFLIEGSLAFMVLFNLMSAFLQSMIGGART